MKNSAVTGIRYDSVGMICITSRIGDRTAETRSLRPARIPSGSPMTRAIRTAASIRLSVAMLASHRPRAPSEANPAVTRSVSRQPPKIQPSAPASPMTPGHPSDAMTLSKNDTSPAIADRAGSRIERFWLTQSRIPFRLRNSGTSSSWGRVA
jgi:hypothetical protein